MSVIYQAITVNLTLDTNAYSANDVLGGLLTFALASHASGGGILGNIRINDADAENAAMKLFLFNALPATTIADDAAYAISAADQALCFYEWTIAAADWQTNTDGWVHDKPNCIFAADGDLYGYLVATATPTYTAATDLQITIDVMLE
jgi:hypothetical protein